MLILNKRLTYLFLSKMYNNAPSFLPLFYTLNFNLFHFNSFMLSLFSNYSVLSSSIPPPISPVPPSATSQQSSNASGGSNASLSKEEQQKQLISIQSTINQVLSQIS